MYPNGAQWQVQEGMLLNTAANIIYTPIDYGEPIFYEDLSELYFSQSNAVLSMSELAFNVFYKDYCAARQLCSSRKIKFSDGRFAELENTWLRHPDGLIDLAECDLCIDINGLQFNKNPKLVLEYNTVEVLRMYRLVKVLSCCRKMMQQVFLSGWQGLEISADYADV